MIRQATISDYRGIAIAIGKAKKVSYMNKSLLKDDIARGNCYIKVVLGKIVCVGSIVWDNEQGLHYIKRLAITNKKNRGKGYAREFISFASQLHSPIAITPWKDNKPMIALVESLGFNLRYLFLENYMFYVKERRL